MNGPGRAEGVPTSAASTAQGSRTSAQPEAAAQWAQSIAGIQALYKQNPPAATPFLPAGQLAAYYANAAQFTVSASYLTSNPSTAAPPVMLAQRSSLLAFERLVVHSSVRRVRDFVFLVAITSRIDACIQQKRLRHLSPITCATAYREAAHRPHVLLTLTSLRSPCCTTRI